MATLFLCGDVMAGRGIDQIQAHPGEPRLHEAYVADAREYVRLAERAHGPIPRPVEASYVWGAARDLLARVDPDARIINLETSITVRDEPWPGKAVHYRMHPKNLGVLASARPDVCGLANNHVMDHGRRGLEDTLDALASARLQTAGAGRTIAEAEQPAILPLRDRRRLIVLATCDDSSGVPADWRAEPDRAGVDWLPELSDANAEGVAARIKRVRGAGDIALVSIHWGSNWGYDIPSSHVRFAHRLIEAGVDVIHGHSSHHPRPIEVYRGRLILYGCGDFINDYEGIAGYESFRGHLVLMYLPTFDAQSGALRALRMVPLRIHQMTLTPAASDDVRWLERTLDRVCQPFGSRVTASADGTLALSWQ